MAFKAFVITNNFSQFKQQKGSFSDEILLELIRLFFKGGIKRWFGIKTNFV